MYLIHLQQLTKYFVKKKWDDKEPLSLNYILKKKTKIEKLSKFKQIKKCNKLNIFNELTNQSIKIDIDDINS